jgi:hypothetical protein
LKKQRHTAKRIFERLRDEHGFTGGITIVKDYVADWRQRSQRLKMNMRGGFGGGKSSGWSRRI